ncbi:MAG: calcineurin-like phosphoesterase family protein [Planctomycetales bacterium]|nr:calcineurin-like phosphoesterase family protein [Planctomycetales bacterium]
MRVSLGEDRVINDLHAFVKATAEPIQRQADVHFTEDGSKQLARQVVDSITSQLHPQEVAHQTARGVVYADLNGNQVFDSGDTPLAGVRVSNGHEITTTAADGKYELEIDDDAAVFVIKPRGYRTAVDENQLPRFYYLHKPQGSPESRFTGVAPTGPLPESIDFPLYAQQEPDQFKALMFGDPQPRNQREVDYIAHDVVEELIGTDASFGVTLGDITFDNLALFEPQARAIAVLGIPWYNVIGNHDMNYDAKSDRQSDESFERVFGPNYYSFDYGTVHFLVLDDVEWLIDETGKGRYQGGLGKRQMDFVRRDLEMIPADQLVVLMMHIPLINVRDRQELYRLIEQRPFAMSISAHAHTHEHHYITRDDGWRGPAPHHHVINVTVCGSWWSGLDNERGIPHATMADGAPNGYSILHFDGHKYQLEFRAAGRRADFQMSVYAPEVVNVSQQAQLEIFANVYNGSEKDSVSIWIDELPAQAMEYTRSKDPAFVKTSTNEQEMRDRLLAQGVPEEKLWIALPQPATSTHLWKQQVDLGSLADGVHLIHVESKLADGQQVRGRRLIRIERNPSPQTLTSEGE